MEKREERQRREVTCKGRHGNERIGEEREEVLIKGRWRKKIKRKENEENKG